MPACRVYARHFVRDKPADVAYRALCAIQFRRTHGFWPDLNRPRRFTEKLWSRMLHDRDPRLTLLSDKLRVRDYVASRVGADYLVPLLWQGADPGQIPFATLPARFVIKATHGCAYNILVREKLQLDTTEAKRKLANWLKINYGEDFCLGIEWGYRNVPPAIIVESFIGDSDVPPMDFKFYCFAGRVEFLTQHFGRFVKHKTRSFDRNYGPHEFHYQFEQYEGECPRPRNFEEMIRVAETLAAEFAFIRVDLYNVEGRIYFGELTPYPGGVSTKFLPGSLDRALGDKWPDRGSTAK